MGHYIADSLAPAVQFERDTDRLSDVACVLDAHSQQFSDLIESSLISWTNLLITLFVNELDDAVWLAILRSLARQRVSVHGSNHEIFYVPYFGLVVDLIDETGLFFSVVTDNEVACLEDLP